MTEPGTLEQAARRWLEDDPDPDTRAELEALIAARDGAELADRFRGPLEFGTAGLRGAMGAGPNRMNLATVRLAASGLARHLVASVEGAADRGVVIGFDARHKSAAFALDSARVLAAEGVTARLLPRPLPTPVLAFAVLHLGCAAGVMVTASHNPARDNGYKVYAEDGAQIVPPADERISAAIAQRASVADVPVAAEDDPRIVRLGGDVLEAYLAAAEAAVPPGPRAVRIVYTPMHGVGADAVLALLSRCGFPDPVVVEAQRVPDPDFPTVAFPNPEEPGALDLAFEEAARAGADIVVANDPDADRVAVAVPDGGGWRRLTGDEVGALLAHHLLTEVEPPDARRPLVTTTVVSSRLLRAIAAGTGAAYAETLTGFKWLVRPALAHPELRPVLAYEEALGYCVGEVVRDKDGMTAAAVVAGLAARLLERGETLADRLADLGRHYGVHATRQWSARFEGPAGSETVATLVGRLRSAPPSDVGGLVVERVRDLVVDHEPPEGSVGGPLAPTDAVVLDLEGGARVVVRPSGTEPKLKTYFEVVVPWDRRADASGLLDALEAAMRSLLGQEG